MRPIRLDLDPANVDITGFASNVTGASWTLTANNSGDNLAHQVSVRNDAVTDHSLKTAILTGTDADGKSQTETINLPAGSATVESSKYFLTLDSIVPSATIGGDTMDIGWLDEFCSKTIVLDHYASVAPAAQVAVTGTINFDIEETLENPIKRTSGDFAENIDPFTYTDQSDLAWLNDANFTGKTASLINSLAIPGIRAIRVVANSYTDGAELQVWITQPYANR